jgi:hypothetical protein
MADLGMSNAHVNRFGGSADLTRLGNGATRRKLQTVIHVALFSAAFIFIAAIVCGVLV